MAVRGFQKRERQGESRRSFTARMLSLVFVSVLVVVSCQPSFAEQEKLIALTFDDGPHRTMTDDILEVLARYDVKATFFVIGRNALEYPDVLRRVAAAGHEIGNHTHTHPKLREQNAESFAEELTEAEKAIGETIGISPTLFRPPEGFLEGVIETVAKEHGYRTVLWSVDTLDWTDAPATDIERRIMQGVKDGGIILCHDYIVGKGHTAEALNRVIPRLLEEGYRFVCVSELLGS